MFVLLVEVDCVVDELDQICIEVHSLVFFLLCCVVYVFDHVIVLLVV